jgi:YD repeat-containing protein
MKKTSLKSILLIIIIILSISFVYATTYTDPQGDTWDYVETNGLGEIYSSPSDSSIIGFKNSDGNICIYNEDLTLDAETIADLLSGSCALGEQIFNNYGCLINLDLDGDEYDVQYTFFPGFEEECIIQTANIGDGEQIFTYNFEGYIANEDYEGTEWDVNYLYYSDGNLFKVSRGGVNTIFIYDADGVITSELTDIEGEITVSSYDYDSEDRLIEHISPGLTQNFGYDADGRIKTEVYEGTLTGEVFEERSFYESSEYGYDTNDNIISFTDATGLTVYFEYESVDYSCTEISCLDFSCPDPESCYTFYDCSSGTCIPYDCSEFEMIDSTCSYDRIKNRRIGNYVVNADYETEELTGTLPDGTTYTYENEVIHSYSTIDEESYSPLFEFDDGLLMEDELYNYEYDETTNLLTNARNKIYDKEIDYEHNEISLLSKSDHPNPESLGESGEYGYDALDRVVMADYIMFTGSSPVGDWIPVTGAVIAPLSDEPLPPDYSRTSYIARVPGDISSIVTEEELEYLMDPSRLDPKLQAVIDSYEYLIEPICGNGVCNEGESCNSCESDCALACRARGGTEENPIKISTSKEFQDMNDDLTAYYELTNDIDLSETSSWNNGKGFSPIGNSTHPFEGTLDGNNHNISNLYINRPGEQDVGLFGYSTGKISNIGLESSYVSGSIHVGSLVGRLKSSGIINNTYVLNAVVTAPDAGKYNQNIGGLVGYLDPKDGGLYNSYSVTDVSCSGTCSNTIGGLYGFRESGVIVDSSFYDNEVFNAEDNLGKTTAEMKQKATYENWDFENTWDIRESVSYPYFKSEDSDNTIITLSLDGEAPYTIKIKSSKDVDGYYLIAKTSKSEFTADLSYAIDQTEFYYEITDKDNNIVEEGTFSTE